jgi:hypothetical protein
MADIDEKTQKLIDKAVKTAKKDQLKLVTDAIKEQQTAAKDLEGEGKAKKLVGDALRDTMKAVKDAVAE